jgi:hypothetical protein
MRPTGWFWAAVGFTLALGACTRVTKLERVRFREVYRPTEG